MIDLAKQRQRAQVNAAKKKAAASGVQKRRSYLRLTIDALERAIEKHPDNLKLLTELDAAEKELRGLAAPDERQRLAERLADVEREMESGAVDLDRAQALIAERSQLLEDIAGLPT